MRKLSVLVAALLLVGGLAYASAAQGAPAAKPTTTTAPTTTTMPAVTSARTIWSESVAPAVGATMGTSRSCANGEVAFNPTVVAFDGVGGGMHAGGMKWVALPDFGTGQYTGTQPPRGYFIQAVAEHEGDIIRFYLTCVRFAQ